MQWAVCAFKEWRINKLKDNNNFDIPIFHAGIDKVDLFDKESFNYVMCQFVPEVVKLKDGTDYPGKTLYEMVTSIQKYLIENKLPWKLLDDVEFVEIRNVLDNTMKECTESNLGTVKHYDLRRHSVSKPSQLTFKWSSDGQHCLVYHEDSVTKTNYGGLNSLKKDRKVVWVFPNKDINCCTVRLVDKYMSLVL